MSDLIMHHQGHPEVAVQRTHGAAEVAGHHSDNG